MSKAAELREHLMDGLQQNDALAKASERLITAFDRTDIRTVRSTTPPVFGVLWGWYARATRQASLVLSAYRAGMSSEAAPVLRSLMEHGLWMLWLSDGGDAALTALELEDLEHKRRLVSGAVSGGWPLPEDMDSIEAPSLDDMEIMKGFPEFESLLRAYSQDYLPYRVTSALTHATIQTARLYVDINENGSATVLKKPRSGAETSTAVGQTYISLRIASLVMLRHVPSVEIRQGLVEAEEISGLAFPLPVGLPPAGKVKSSAYFGLTSKFESLARQCEIAIAPSGSLNSLASLDYASVDPEDTRKIAQHLQKAESQLRLIDKWVGVHKT